MVANTITAVDNYYRILAEHCAGTSRAMDGDVLVGYSSTDEGRLRYGPPTPPAQDIYWVKPWNGRDRNPRKIEYSYKPIDGWIRTEVLNHGLDRRQQKWRTPPLPNCWHESSLVKMAFSNGWTYRKNGKVVPDMDKFRDPENLTDEQYTHAVREWHRRIFGSFIWINERLTYMTGAHYYYLTAFQLDNGFPQYRDRDRRWYYAWQHCIEDGKCLGMVYLKHRRDGATYRCGSIGLEIATRGHARGANFGIMSKDDESAREAFRTKVVTPFQSMPFYFAPKVKDKTDVEKVLEFRAPPRSQSERFLADGIGLDSQVEYKSKGKKGRAGFDSYKLFVLLMDEIGKIEGVSVLDMLDLVTPTLDLDGAWGKLLATSTNEELEGDTKDEFEKFFYRSDPRLCHTNGTGATTTRLKSYFTPAYDGLSMAWIGPYGESIVHKPNEEQMEHLLSLGEEIVDRNRSEWEKGGAYEYLVAERLVPGIDVLKFKRKYPFNPEESFASVNEKSDFNMGMLSKTITALTDNMGGGKTREQVLTIRGCLEWVGNIEKGDVYFAPDENGNFLVNRRFLPVDRKDGAIIRHTGKDSEQWGGEMAERLQIWANNVHRATARQGYPEAHGLVRPRIEDSWIVIGMDPQKIEEDQNRDKRISKAASHGFYPYNPKVDGPWTAEMERNIGFAEHWESHSFVFHYLHHPKNSRVHHMDMLKACIFWNARILYERNINEFGNFMLEIGADWRNPASTFGSPVKNSFMVYDLEWAKDKRKAVPGIHSSDEYIKMGLTRTEAWIDKHCYPERCPFPELLKQWVSFDRKRITIYDAVVSAMWGLLAAQPGELRFDQKSSNLHPAPPMVTMMDCYPDYSSRR